MEKILTAVLSLALSATCPAVEPPPAEDLQGAVETPMDLGRIEVLGESLSFEQELQWRLVRQALKNKRSDEREDIDDWVCWFEPELGSRIRRLKCARNGDLWALRPVDQAPGAALAAGAAGPPGSGYGTIWVAELPLRKRKLEELLAQMPGNDEFDREFIDLAAQGQRPPRDIPDEAELDRFAAAYLEVDRLLEQNADDAALQAAIEAHGLALERYNQIVDLIDTYQSLMNQVAQRIGRMPPG